MGEVLGFGRYLGHRSGPHPHSRRMHHCHSDEERAQKKRQREAKEQKGHEKGPLPIIEAEGEEDPPTEEEERSEEKPPKIAEPPANLTPPHIDFEDELGQALEQEALSFERPSDFELAPEEMLRSLEERKEAGEITQETYEEMKKALSSKE